MSIRQRGGWKPHCSEMVTIATEERSVNATQTLPSEILTVAQMYAADGLAAASGISSLSLMEAAGLAVARVIRAKFQKQHVLVLCGPGNNGGDGFVVARYLWQWGWPVRVALVGDVAALKGEAASQAKAWVASGGYVSPLEADTIDDLLRPSPFIVDAMFGAGLSRGLSGVTATAVRKIQKRGLACVAVDVPSGVHGDTGQVLSDADHPQHPGLALSCALTVTFFRAKPAHVVYPARALCGEVVVADIGIPAAVLEAIRPRLFINDHRLWAVPQPDWQSHKHRRGHVVVFGGQDSGATRLAGRAARRMGAGLLTFAVPGRVISTYAQEEPGAFVKAIESAEDIETLLADARRNVVLIGPGYGLGPATGMLVLRLLSSDKAVVLDADALTQFAADPRLLIEAIQARSAPTVITPHEGEFVRLFPDSGPKIDRAVSAAANCRAVVVLKGADSVIASPDGLAAVNVNAPAWLATGGSGDVLAGAIAGLLAQGASAWHAACAAVWRHGDAGTRVGPGLIAEDLADRIR
jgi:ADP-dependent NAD(P)H-hydrate dehydratase / NAD(P)H-hydrate epimerase